MVQGNNVHTRSPHTYTLIIYVLYSCVYIVLYSSLSLSLSIPLSISFSLSLPLSPPLHLTFFPRPSVWRQTGKPFFLFSFSLPLSLSLSLCISISHSLSLYLTLSLFLYHSLSLSFPISIWIQCRVRDIGGHRGHMPPCSETNSTDKGTHLVFGSLKLLKPKAHFTNWEGILIHELTLIFEFE